MLVRCTARLFAAAELLAMEDKLSIPCVKVAVVGDAGVGTPTFSCVWSCAEHGGDVLHRAVPGKSAFVYQLCEARFVSNSKGIAPALFAPYSS